LLHCVQAALDAFQAYEYGDFVGQLSSFCVAGLDTAVVEDREGALKQLVEGSNTPEAQPESADRSKETDASQEPEVGEEGGDEEDAERARRAGASWDAKILNGSGWRVGLKGRKINIEFKLFNIYSPTGASLRHHPG
jgi:hypothetical protein